MYPVVYTFFFSSVIRLTTGCANFSFISLICCILASFCFFRSSHWGPSQNPLSFDDLEYGTGCEVLRYFLLLFLSSLLESVCDVLSLESSLGSVCL